MNSFSNFYNIQELCETQSLYFHENFDWARPFAKMTSHINIEIPVIKKKSRIHIIDANKNPIILHFCDGSRIFLTNDEYRRFPKISTGNEAEFTMFDKGKNQPMIIKSFRIIS